MTVEKIERTAKVQAIMANVYLDQHFRSGMVDRRVRESFVVHWVEFMLHDLGPKASAHRAMLAAQREVFPMVWWWPAFVLRRIISPMLVKFWEGQEDGLL